MEAREKRGKEENLLRDDGERDDDGEKGDDDGLLPRQISGLIFPAEAQRRRDAVGRDGARPSRRELIFRAEGRRRGVFKLHIQTPIHSRLR